MFLKPSYEMNPAFNLTRNANIYLQMFESFLISYVDHRASLLRYILEMDGLNHKKPQRKEAASWTMDESSMTDLRVLVR